MHYFEWGNFLGGVFFLLYMKSKRKKIWGMQSLDVFEKCDDDDDDDLCMGLINIYFLSFFL